MNPGCLCCFSGDEIREVSCIPGLFQSEAMSFPDPRSDFPGHFPGNSAGDFFWDGVFFCDPQSKLVHFESPGCWYFCFGLAGVYLFVGFCVFCLLSCFCLGFLRCVGCFY